MKRTYDVNIAARCFPLQTSWIGQCLCIS